MLALSQGSQYDKSLISHFFTAIISVNDKYTMCVTKTTPFWIIDRTLQFSANEAVLHVHIPSKVLKHIKFMGTVPMIWIIPFDI